MVDLLIHLSITIKGGQVFLNDRAHADKEGYGPLFLTW